MVVESFPEMRNKWERKCGSAAVDLRVLRSSGKTIGEVRAASVAPFSGIYVRNSWFWGVPKGFFRYVGMCATYCGTEGERGRGAGRAKARREQRRWQCVVRHGCRCRGQWRPMSLAAFSLLALALEACVVAGKRLGQAVAGENFSGGISGLDEH